MIETPVWVTPPADVSLKEDEVHLWRVDLDLASKELANSLSVLNQAEKDRATRLVFEKDRIRFVSGRSVLRILLAKYLSCSPGEIGLTSGPTGKPGLYGTSRLRFNLSHSAGLAVYVFGLGREVGADLESLRTGVAYTEIAQSHFSPKEQAEFSRVPEAEQMTAFYSGWTRKEAYLKARGDGLQVPLNGFSVSLGPGPSFQLDSEDTDLWGMYSFCPQEGFIGALVVEGKYWKPVFLEWPGLSAV